MNTDLRIGFIGFGNMAQAITKGLIVKEVVRSSQISACAGCFERLQKNAAAYGIQAFRTAEEMIQKSDFVVIALKPYQIDEVIGPLKELLKDKVLISVAGGYGFERYAKLLGKGVHHISTIPNTPIAVGEGILVTESRHSLTEEEFSQFNELFSPIALIEMVEPQLLSIAGTLSGCTPAFTAMYLEALGDAGVKYGLSRDTAYRMAAKMLSGSGKLQLESKDHPGRIKDAVCSPGGTTIKGVSALEKGGFRGLVISAIDAIEKE